MNKNNPSIVILINGIFVIALFLAIPPMGDNEIRNGYSIRMILSVISFFLYEFLNAWKLGTRIYSSIFRIVVFVGFVWGINQRCLK